MRRLPTLLAAALVLAGCQPAHLGTKEYAYPAWGFKASFQAKPTETNQPGTPDGSQPNAYLDEASDGHRDFAVWAADVSKASESFEDLASSASTHVGGGLGAKPGIQSYAATSEGVEGREFAFTQDGKWQATMRVFAAGGKFYEVIGKSVYGQNDPAISDFLSSFHTLPGAPAATNAPINAPASISAATAKPL